jgi:endonuclease/exonuclease/phosphatase family metal-dependent hydrolase
MSCHTNYNNFKIFNVVRRYLLHYINNSVQFVNKIDYYLHGGGQLLHHFDDNIIENIASKLINMTKSETLKNNDCDNIMLALFTEDIDIVVRNNNVKDTIITQILENVNNNINSFNLIYIHYIFTKLKNLPFKDSKYELKKEILINGAHRIKYIITANNKKYKFDFCDVYAESNFKWIDTNLPSNIINSEFKSLLDNYKENKIITKHQKRAFRILLYINMLCAHYINPLVVETVSNIRFDIMLEEINYFTDYLKNTNFITIKRLSDIDFNLDIGAPNIKNYYAYNNEILKRNIEQLQLFITKKRSKSVLQTSDLYPESNIIKQILYSHYGIPMNNSNVDKHTALTEYYNTLVGFDDKNAVKNYTSNYYFDLNTYMIDKIYKNRETDEKIEQDNRDIYYMADDLSLKYNSKIIGNDSFYVIRGENFINTFKGSYYNLKKNDIYVLPTHYSTSLKSAFNKSIILRIKLNRNSTFIIVTKYSNVPSEQEILLPFGSILRVTDSKEILYNNEKKLLIDFEYIALQKIYKIAEFIDYYQRTYLQTNFLSLGYDVGISNAIVHNNLGQIAISFSNIPSIVNINNIDIANPYKDIKLHVNQKLAEIPSFFKDQAYIGEVLAGNKQLFCNNDVNIENINKEVTKISQNILKILTFNVHNFVRICLPHGKNVSFISIVRALKPDILCLQEIVPHYDDQPYTQNEIKAGTFQKLVKLIEEQTGLKYYAITNQTYDYMDDYDYYLLANGIFSRYEIIKTYSYGLSGNRSVQIIVIKFNGLELNIVNTHLEFNDNKIINSLNKPLIEVQIKQLISILQTHKNFIMTGDFNHNIIQSKLFTDLLKLCKVYSPHQTNINNASFTGFNNPTVLDWILVSNDIEHFIDKDFVQFNKIIQSDSSDHYPVFAALKFIDSDVDIEDIENTAGNRDIYRRIKIHFRNKKQEKINILLTGNSSLINRPDTDIFIYPNRTYTDTYRYPFQIYLPLRNNTRHLDKLKDLYTYLKTLNFILDINIEQPYDKIKDRITTHITS